MRRESNPLSGVIEPSLPVGSRLDDYRIEQQIGWGSVAQVYRAIDLRSNETVALKILQPRYAVDLEVAARLAREATAVSRIDNPHVVRITRLAECDRGPYIVMEYIEGTPLDEILRLVRTLSAAQLLQISLQVCEALGAAHDQGVVHRDLKPENIIIIGSFDQAPFIKLIDFGVAKVSLDAIHVASTRPGTIVGSPGYMAPEQIRSLPIDARTDIYGFGVLLYELISGRRPFEGELLQEVLAGHVMRPPPPLSTEGQPVDPCLEALVFRCLAKAPADRPASMREVGETLRAVAADVAPAVLIPPPAKLVAGDEEQEPAFDPSEPEAVEPPEPEVAAPVVAANNEPLRRRPLRYGAAAAVIIVVGLLLLAQIVC